MTFTSRPAARLGMLATLAIVLLAACTPSSNSDEPTRFVPPTKSSASPAPAPGTGAVQAPDANLRAWETPARMIATSSRSADWAQRYWNHADEWDKNWTIEFGFDEPSNDYSVPVYSSADATTTTRVFQRPPAFWNGRFDVPSGSTIPWNPSWLPSDGNDGFMVIVDPTTGKEWDIWAMSTPLFHPDYLKQTECLMEPGFNPDADVCAAGLLVISQPGGQTADVRSYRGNYPIASGGGLQNTAGLTTPDEVKSGAIRHALKFMVSGRLAMMGPQCPDDVTSADDPRVGSSCGVAVAPAGQFERIHMTASSEQLSQMVPHGTRLVVDMSDAQIEAWLNSRGYTGTLRNTARVFAVALRDYGLIQTDTTGGPALIQVSGARNAATAAGWRELGIEGDGVNLLDGLVTSTNIRVLAAPTNHCESGLSKLACWAADIRYG